MFCILSFMFMLDLNPARLNAIACTSRMVCRCLKFCLPGSSAPSACAWTVSGKVGTCSGSWQQGFGIPSAHGRNPHKDRSKHSMKVSISLSDF